MVPCCRFDLPGRWEVLVEEVAPGEAEQTLADGARRLPGQTLAELRRRLGGDEGELGDPVRGRHRVSLARWRDADPQTRLRVAFVFTPDRPLPPDDARRMRVERRLLRAAMPASEAEARTLPQLLDRPLPTFRMERAADGRWSRGPTTSPPVRAQLSRFSTAQLEAALAELVADGEAMATADGWYWTPRPAPSCAPRR